MPHDSSNYPSKELTMDAQTVDQLVPATASSVQPEQQGSTTSTVGPKPGAMDDTLYTTEELAAWLRISPSTIEKDRSLGRGSYPVFVKVGGRRVMYRHADVITWLQGNRFRHDMSRA